jgi:iron complex outermembrane recepter protein
MASVVFRSIVLGLPWALVASAYASADAPTKVDIPAGYLVTSLESLARQSGCEFLYTADQLKGVRTAGVSGEYTPEDAIKKLLEGTRLRLTVHESGALVITLPPQTKVAGDAHTQSVNPEIRSALVLAQAGDTSTKDVSASAASGDQKAEIKKRQDEVPQVTVTAERRAEQLQTVPMAISVLGGADLDASTSRSLSEELSRVPGVTINQMFLGGGVQIPIRGVAASSALAGGTAPTAYYLDSVPFGMVRNAIGPDPDVYDLQRVEVLRGPQGTLYGASALNGVVRVLTNDADLNSFELKARTATSDTDGGGQNYRGEMALNVPIVEGKLAARAVAGYQSIKGWIDEPNRQDVNDDERLNLRLKVNAQPTDQLSLGFSIWHSRTNEGAPFSSNDQDFSTATQKEPVSTNYDTYGLKVGYQFTSFAFSSTTSYLSYHNDSFLDYNPGSGRLLETDYHSKTFAQEISLNSTTDGFWRWSLGGIYRDSSDVSFQNIPNVYTAPTQYTDYSKSNAVYGELTRLFLDRTVELTAGLRHFNDDVSLREDSRLSGVPASQLVRSGNTFDATTPRLVLSWHPNGLSTVYSSYSEGFRSGSVQPPAVLAVAPLPPVLPDKLKNYEVGAKSSVWGGRLSFDTAVYYIDWEKVQQALGVRVPVGTGFRTLTAVVNGNSASGIGYEAGLTVRLFQRLTLNANFNWNNLKFDSDVLSAGVVLFNKGSRLSFSPEYTAGASADYAFPLRNGYEIRLSASGTYTSIQETTSLSGGVASTVRGGDPMLIARSGLSLAAPLHWAVTLYVDNLTNANGSPALAPGNPNWSIRIPPRTIGGQAEYHF